MKKVKTKKIYVAGLILGVFELFLAYTIPSAQAATVTIDQKPLKYNDQFVTVMYSASVDGKMGGDASCTVSAWTTLLNAMPGGSAVIPNFSCNDSYTFQWSRTDSANPHPIAVSDPKQSWSMVRDLPIPAPGSTLNTMSFSVTAFDTQGTNLGTASITTNINDMLNQLGKSQTTTSTSTPQNTGLLYSLSHGQICEPIQSLSTSSSEGTSLDASTNLARCVNNIYVFSIGLGGFVGVLMFVFAGYLYTFGTQQSVKEAKSIIGSTVAGLVLLFIAYAFLNTVGGEQLTNLKNLNTLPAIYCDGSTENCNITKTDNITVTPGPNANEAARQSGIKNAGGYSATVLLSAGCTFQQDSTKNEVPYMVPEMFSATKAVCASAKQAVGPIQISSVIGLGKHATNSLHYVGCAVDFAGGNTNFINSAQGKAILAAAQSLGFAQHRDSLTDSYRINPGTDENRADMIHLDLGAKCPPNN